MRKKKDAIWDLDDEKLLQNNFGEIWGQKYNYDRLPTNM